MGAGSRRLWQTCGKQLCRDGHERHDPVRNLGRFPRRQSLLPVDVALVLWASRRSRRFTVRGAQRSWRHKILDVVVSGWCGPVDNTVGLVAIELAGRFGD